MTRIHDIHPGEENEISQSGRLLLFLGFTIGSDCYNCRSAEVSISIICNNCCLIIFKLCPRVTWNDYILS
jgi:hypothetical protein